MAVIEMGTCCRDSSRRRAVTMTSSSVAQSATPACWPKAAGAIGPRKKAVASRIEVAPHAGARAGALFCRIMIAPIIVLLIGHGLCGRCGRSGRQSIVRHKIMQRVAFDRPQAVSYQ